MTGLSGETLSADDDKSNVCADCGKNIHQDLLSGKACNRVGIRIILDADPDIAVLYPLDADKQQHIEELISFIPELTELYLLEKEEMDWRKFHETNGYDLWHRRLMHCPKRNIRESIPFAKGMEKLLNYRYDEHDKCASCRSAFAGPPWAQ
jgi:hypothetical protein